jgi:membrane protease YdiL (CAAX protease family)
MQGLIRYFRKGLRTQPTSRIGYNTQKNNPKMYNTYLRFKHWLYTHKYVLSIIISSIVFGSLHWQGTNSFGQILVPILTGLIGVVLALVALKTRRLGLGIFIHIFFNSTTIILSLFM